MPTSENYFKEITIVLPEDTYFIANLTTDKRCMYENNIYNAEIEGSASVSSFQGTNFTSQPDEAILYDTTFTQNGTSINFWGTNIHNGTVVELIYNNNGTQDDQSLLKISTDTFGNCTINNVTIAELFKQDAQPHFYSFGITFSGPIHVWVDGELVAQTDNVQSTYLSGYQISIGSFITGDIMSSQNFNSLSVTNQLWGNDVNELIGKHCGVPPVEVYDSPSSVINYYNITTQILANEYDGTITPTNPRVAEGNNKVFNIVAGEGNYIYFIKLDDVDVPGVAGNYLSTYQYTLENIRENHIIRVAFMNEPATYNFTSSVTNGSCAPASAIVYETGSLSVIVTPNQDYEINSITINGTEIEVTDREEQSVTVENISGDIHLVATCVESSPAPVGSYYTLVSDPETRIPFHIDNTPLANFCTSYADTESITINGQSVVKNTIKELSFADEYNVTTSINNYFLSNLTSLSTVDISALSNVTSIGDTFLSQCSSLTSVDLSSFVNVTSIGDTFLQGCSSLTSVGLAPFSNVTSVGNSFLHGCSSLTSVDLTGLSNVSSISNRFLYDCSSLTSIDLPSFSNVTSIGYSFLSGCSSLTSIDLSVFSNVTSIASYFLSNCSSLTSIDLSVFSNVTSIGYSFLSGCSSLTSIDLSVFSNVTSIASYFLSNCSSLTSIDLSVFSNVTSIGAYFLSNCYSLTSVDLSPFSNVTTIYSYFLSSCTGLTSVTIDAGDWSTKTIGENPMYGVGNLSTNKVISNTSCVLANNFKTAIGQNISNWTVECPAYVGSYYTLVSDPTTKIPFHIDNTPLANFCTTGNGITSIAINGESVVKNTIKELSFADEYSITTTIPIHFLRYLPSLSTVDLSVFSNVTSIGDYFLYYCPGLTSVDLSPFSNITSIGNGFLRDCSSLTSIDLSPLSNVSSISNNFLYNCYNLTSIDLSGFSNVTSIEANFVTGCSSLTSVDLSPLSNVTSIGNYFLSSCSSLTSIDLSPLNNVTSIEANFVTGCSSLTSVDLSPLSNVTSIGNYFLSSCTSLTSVDLSGLSNVTSIGTDFLHNCSSLTSVDFSGLSNVTSIDNYFLQGCSSLTSIDLSPLSNVSSISNNFLYNCYNLTSIDLSGFSNVTSIGNYFLTSCTSLTSIDLSPFSNVTSIGTGFLNNCTSLTSVTIDAGDWSTKTVGNYAMQYVNNIATNKVISNTSCVLANNFKIKIGAVISNWTVQCPV